MKPSRSQQVTSTGAAVSGGGTCRGVVLTAGDAAAAEAVITDGSGGVVLLTLKAPQGTSVPVPLTFQFANGLYVTLSGAGAELFVLT